MSGNIDIKQRKAEVLNNSYRKDGLVKFTSGDVKGALKLFNLVSYRTHSRNHAAIWQSNGDHYQ
jgi:hypothetical protein